MTTGDRIKELRTKKGMSQEELGAKIGVKKAAINKYESGLVVNFKQSTIAKLASALDVSPIYLMGWDDGESDISLMGHIDTGKTKALQFPKHDEADDIANRYRNLDDHGKGAVRAILDFEEASAIADKRQRKPVKPRSDGFVDVKVFDQVSAAGLGNYLDDPVYHMEQYPANEVPDGTEFGVRISGVSMSPKIPDGATAFVQSRSAIEPGKIGIFLVNGESFCKKLVVDRDRQEIRLASFNPDYKDRVIEDADVFSTMGLVLGWWPHG